MADETVETRVKFPDGSTAFAEVPEDKMEDLRDREVIPIDPNSRYVVIAKYGLSMQEAVNASRSLQEWWNSDRKFFVLGGDYELQRVGDITEDDIRQLIREELIAILSEESSDG